jgi:hypothetical protein
MTDDTSLTVVRQPKLRISKHLELKIQNFLLVNMKVNVIRTSRSSKGQKKELINEIQAEQKENLQRFYTCFKFQGRVNEDLNTPTSKDSHSTYGCTVLVPSMAALILSRREKLKVLFYLMPPDF